MASKAMLGNRLRRLRRDKGLTQVQLAEQVGISPSYLNLIEHNQRPVTVPLLLKLTEALGADLSAFNTGDEKIFLAANEKTMTPELLAKRPAEERAKLFQRLRGDFAAIKVARMIKSTPAQIVFVALLKDGNEGTFTYDFEEKAPFRISRLAIDVEVRDRH